MSYTAVSHWGVCVFVLTMVNSSKMLLKNQVLSIGSLNIYNIFKFDCSMKVYYF